jgi:hypothetical protein
MAFRAASSVSWPWMSPVMLIEECEEIGHSLDVYARLEPRGRNPRVPNHVNTNAREACLLRRDLNGAQDVAWLECPWHDHCDRMPVFGMRLRHPITGFGRAYSFLTAWQWPL